MKTLVHALVKMILAYKLAVLLNNVKEANNQETNVTSIEKSIICVYISC